jgi:hypothetical protein
MMIFRFLKECRMQLFTRFLTLSSLAVLTMTAPSAFAFYTVQESGDLLKPKEMQAGGEIQFITSGNDGVNFIGRLDKGLTDDSNLRFIAGAGTTDVFFAAYAKWVPFPDFEKQPAIGFSAGVQYGHYESSNELGLRFIPFVSKKFDTEIGELAPYAALPLGFMNYDDEGYTPVQLTLGSRYKHPDFDSCEFNAELAFDVNDAFAYLAFGAIFPAFE